MVNVNKNIVPGKPAESSAKSKAPARRPRNQELNSSKKEAVQKIRRSLNSSMATDLDRLVGDVKASNATDYNEKYATLAQHPAYEEELMADAYYKAEQKLSEMYDIPNVMLETSVQQGRGSVDAYTDGGEPGSGRISSYDFSDETEAIWDLIKSWDGDTAGLVDAVAQKIVDLVELNFEDDGYAYVQGENGLDSSCGENLDSSSSADVNIEGCLKTLLNHLLDYAPKEIHSKAYLGDLDTPLEDATFYVEADGKYVDPITKAYTSIKGDDYDAFIAQPGIADIPIHYLCTETMGYNGWKDTTMGNLRRVLQEEVSKIDASDVNSSKNRSVNCSEEEPEGDADVGFEQYFNKVTDQQLADYYGISVKDITDTDNDIEAANYGKVVGHYIPKDEYADVFVDNDWNTLDILEDGTVGFALGEGGGKATKFYGVDIATIEDAVRNAGLDSSRKLNSASSKGSSKKLNCAAEDEVKIITESGNEVPLSEVKVIQNPSTNELMLYVPENGDDEIPEGFTVVYDVVQQGGGSTPDPDGTDDGEDEAKLDSSRRNRAARRRARKLNSSKKKNRR